MTWCHALRLSLMLTVYLWALHGGSSARNIMVSLRSDIDPQFKIELEKALKTEIMMNEKISDCVLDNDSMTAEQRAGSVQITINEACWRTKKARSIAYLFNRYFRSFKMDATVIFRHDREEIKIKNLNAEEGGYAQAQFISNDYYDGDIFPGQNEKLDIERMVCRRLAKKIAKSIGEK